MDPKRRDIRYSTSEENIPTLTPSQWDKLNLAKGFVAHPGYSTGKRKPGQYKEYYDPTEFVPTLTDSGYQWKNTKNPNFDFTTGSPVVKYTPPERLPIVEVDPNVKPVQFNPTSTYNPNTGITTSLEGKILDIEEVPIAAKKKGGLVKGYVDGGEVNDPIDDQRKWLGDYLNSPKYKERLKKEFPSFTEDQINEQLKSRSNNLKNTKVNIVDKIGKKPGFIFGENKNGDVNIEKGYVNYSDYSTIPVHEFGHSVDGGGKLVSELTKKRLGKNLSKDIPNSEYYNNPTEFINRLQPIRYLLDKEGVYDAKSQDFDSEVYKKMQNNPRIKDNQHYKDVFNSLNGKTDAEKEKQFIILMNTIASNKGKDNSGYMKKGGLVGKYKKYANGGQVDDFSNMDGSDPNLISAISAGANMALPGSGALISGGTQLKDSLVNSLSEIDPQTGRYKNKRSANTAGFVNAAYNATPLGMLQTAIDPNKSLGEKALSIGTLGISDFFNSKKNVGDLEAKNAAAVEAKRKEEQMAQNNAMFQTNLSKQLAQRNSYSKGGKVVGKGTGTSDDVTASIKKGSFVVPAKNVAKAKELKKEILGGDKEEKAELHHSEGEPVKLSNGEYVFSPEETQELIANGVDLEDLAPDAEHGEEEMAKGGLTAEKARIILHDKTIRGKPITDKQRRYFGYIANGHKCGGMVKGYADGGEVDGDPFETARKKAIADQKEADLAERKALMEEFKALKARAESGNPVDKFTYNKRLPEIGARLKQISDKHGLSNKEVPSKTGAEINKALGTTSKSTGIVGRSAASLPKTTAQESLDRSMASQDADNLVVPPAYVPPPSTGGNGIVGRSMPKNAIDDAATGIDPNLERFNRDLAAREAELTPTAQTGNKNANIMDGLSTAINYGLPLVQAGIGLNYLKKSGPRPVDVIDPEYTTALANAKTRATYGFTPEEKALIDADNANLTASQRFAARNYSGGSAANAYAMERNAINDSYGRGLKSALANRNLQLSKQQDADRLGLSKVELSRRLFNDKMNAWNQNQQAGSTLLNTGLSNLVGANRYEQEKRAIADNSAIANSWLNNL